MRGSGKLPSRHHSHRLNDMLNLAPAMVYLKDYRPPAFLISTVDLDVDLQSDLARITATLTIRRNSTSAHLKAPLILDGDELELERGRHRVDAAAAPGRQVA